MPNPVETAFQDINSQQVPAARVGLKESLMDSIPLMMGAAADSFAGNDNATKVIALMQRRKQDATQLQFQNMIDLKGLQLNASMKKLEAELAKTDDARKALESSSRIKELDASTAATRALESGRIGDERRAEAEAPLQRQRTQAQTRDYDASAEANTELARSRRSETARKEAQQPLDMIKLIEEIKKTQAETGKETAQTKESVGRTRKAETEADIEEMKLQRMIDHSDFIAKNMDSTDPVKRDMAQQLYFNNKVDYDKANPVDIVRRLATTNPTISLLSSAMKDRQLTPAEEQQLAAEVKIEMMFDGNQEGLAAAKPVLSALNNLITSTPSFQNLQPGQSPPTKFKGTERDQIESGVAETIAPHYKDLLKIMGRNQFRSTVLEDVAARLGMTTTKLEQKIVLASQEYNKLKEEGKFLEKELKPVINNIGMVYPANPNPNVPVYGGGDWARRKGFRGSGGSWDEPGPTAADWEKAQEVAPVRVKKK